MGRQPQDRELKYSPEFLQFIKDNFKVNEETGEIITNHYCGLYLNMAFHGKTVSISYARLVWIISRGEWPKEGMHIDHINDKSMDNRPSNLVELTNADNQAKKRGKGNKYYGKGKYGDGYTIYSDKRDGRFYVQRYLSSKNEIDVSKRKLSLGGFSTLEEAEYFIEQQKETNKKYDENFNVFSLFDEELAA